MLKRKEKILIGALELLEAGGINGLTTKKLAAHQGVSEPALYRQFSGKLAIVKALIEEYASFDGKIMNTIVESDMGSRDAIEFYVRRFAERYKNYSEITTIMFSMDVYYYNDETKAMVKDIHNKRLDFLQSLVEKGQSRGELSETFSAREYAKMIDGMIFSQVYQWRMHEMTTPLVDELVSMVQRLL